VKLGQVRTGQSNTTLNVQAGIIRIEGRDVLGVMAFGRRGAGLVLGHIVEQILMGDVPARSVLMQ
jgi:hypothetical protein